MTNATQNRYKKIQPVVRKRKLELDQQHARVVQFRNMLSGEMAELSQAQIAYMEIVESLNTERSSTGRGQLDILERGADRARTLWYEAFERVKKRERLLASELSILQVAEADFKGVEKLSANIKQAIVQTQERLEQKAQDERAILRFGAPGDLRKVSRSNSDREKKGGV